MKYLYLVSFFISLVCGMPIIKKLKDFKVKQTILMEGPNWHKNKQGTPTMGGIIFLIGFICGSIPLAIYDSKVWMLIFVTLAYSFIGFIDDLAKIRKKQNAGLTPLQKILLQLIVIIIFAIYLYVKNMAFETYIPFIGLVNIGWLFFPMIIVVILGTVNGVNLTDGIDGLAGTVTFIVVLSLNIMALIFRQNYLAVAIYCMGAGILSFLVYNKNPAMVFMGDCGSLALGGFVAASAYLLKAPIFIVIFGIIYLVESLSVILQVGYFKMTNGKRLFKMSPIHHHFEKSGWSENKIVVVFGTVTFIFGILAVYLYYVGVRGSI